MSVTPYTQSDFSGGFTDYYLSAAPNKFRRADNLLLAPHGAQGKLTTRPGSTFFASAAHAQLPSGSSRVGAIIPFNSIYFFLNAKSLYRYVSSNWAEITGPYSGGTGHLFPTGVTVTNVASWSPWGKHLFVTCDGLIKPVKVFEYSSGNYAFVTAGLPALASTPTITAAGTRANAYAFLYEYTYAAGNLTFLDLGPITRTSTATGAASNAISAIPVLANSSDDKNYDITPTYGSLFKVGIYRTTDGGTAYYKVGTVSNGTTTFTDTVTDAQLVLNEPLYTTGGVVENEAPPLCKLVHIIGNVGYYANIQEGSDLRPNRCRQSIPGNPSSSPGDFFVDIDEDIIGLSSARDIPVLLADNSAWRIDGAQDELGRGQMVATRISDTCSCVSGLSVVQTLDGTFWAGKDGFYYTDGFTVTRINEGWDITYATFVGTAAQRRRIVGAYDSIHRRIWWSVQSATGSDIDTSIVLDLRFGVSKDMPFTTASGSAALDGSTNWAPTAIAFSAGDLIRGDTRGYVFQHDDDLTADYLINPNVAATSWYTTAIIYNFVSIGQNFGTDALRKYGTWLDIQCANRTNLSLQPISINDDGRVIENLKLIRFRGNILWGDPTVTWGDPEIAWNKQGTIEVSRRFPGKSLRFSHKQIQLTNAYCVIDNSDLLGTVTVNATTKTAVLNLGAATWSAAYVGYYISFANDLTVDYLITAVTDTTVTYSDAGNTSLTQAGVEFEVKGYPKDEIMDLLAYSIWADAFGTTQEKFDVSELNEV